MRSALRPLVALSLVLAGVYACVDSTKPAVLLSPTVPSFARIKATDSLLQVTDITYGDTALILRRVTPLAQNLSASAVIGPLGGSIKIDSAGVKIDIPAGALSGSTTITMTALAGPNVAYEFQPHGLVFAQPVKVQQDLRVTWAGTNPALLNTAHGGYYDNSLDSSLVDPLNALILLKEHELGYLDANKTQLKFYIGHFSGYVVTSGRSGT